MKYSCDMIKDILSLYCDNVCSEDSRAAVEEHLKECEACRGELNMLRETKYTENLEMEKKIVVDAYKRNLKKKFLIVLSMIFMIPIVICFIVNIAVGHRLDWFFIVLTSLAVLGSMVLVPLAAEKKRFLCIFTSFTASLLLLLLTCCIYSGGTWFPVAAVSVLFGLSVVFLPFAVRQIPIKGRLADHKGVLVMLIDTALLALLILLCVVGDYRRAFSTMGYCMILPWGRYLFRTHGIVFINGGRSNRYNNKRQTCSHNGLLECRPFRMGGRCQLQCNVNNTADRNCIGGDFYRMRHCF